MEIAFVDNLITVRKGNIRYWQEILHWIDISTKLRYFWNIISFYLTIPLWFLKAKKAYQKLIRHLSVPDVSLKPLTKIV